MPDLQPTLPTLKAGPKAEGGGRLPVAGGEGGGVFKKSLKSW